MKGGEKSIRRLAEGETKKQGVQGKGKGSGCERDDVKQREKGKCTGTRLVGRWK